MAELSFDFQRYIDRRKGADQALAQSGEAYVYPGDQKVLRTLARVTPVTLAVEATARLWRSRGGGELLGGAVKVTEKQHPALYHSACQCAERLGVLLPGLYLVRELPGQIAYTFGGSDEAALVLRASLLDTLSPDELRFVLGHEFARVQNQHVVYTTALYYLTTSAGHYLRWIVKPAALALRSWARRAEVSCDRAGLLCSRELGPATSALLRLELGEVELPAGLDPALYLKEVAGERPSADHGALERAHPAMRVRVAALRLFSETHYYLKQSGRSPREQDGKSLAWCDEQVKALLAGLPRDDKTTAGG